MAKAPNKPKYLGDKFDLQTTRPLPKLIAIFALSLGVGFVLGAVLNNPGAGLLAAAACIAFLMLIIINQGKPSHFLVKYDQQSFIANLKLSQKTAIFDGSNIYHFVLANKLGALPLGALVSALRSEGYRIVCFFDANIYHTLRKNGAFPKSRARFSIRILSYVFDLKPNEIYVVPKGIQADKFILESQSHLPISFIVTNDKFRDYKNSYEFLGKDTKWRNEVRIQKQELQLSQHKFKRPLRMK